MSRAFTDVPLIWPKVEEFKFRARAGIAGQREVVIGRQGSRHLADQLISQLENSVSIAPERTLIVLLGIEVNQVDENQIRLLPLK